ncbi:MAG: hypothetical protein Q8O22_08220 [Candidatus Omnitrophota bacterium]|nr:hypothetical protein [Candidatus Omnitrophota bacterium]
MLNKKISLGVSVFLLSLCFHVFSFAETTVDIPFSVSQDNKTSIEASQAEVNSGQDNRAKQAEDFKNLLENNNDNISVRLTLLFIRYPIAVVLLDVLLSVIAIVCTLSLLKVSKIQLSFPVSIVVGMEFASGIAGFSSWFYFKNLALLFPGSTGPFVSTAFFTVGFGLFHIFLGFLLINLFDWARIAALFLIIISCLFGVLRGLPVGFSNQLDNIELSVLIIKLMIYYFCLNKENFKSIEKVSVL